MKNQNLFVTEKLKPVFSVSELIEYLNLKFSHMRVTVEGEITKFDKRELANYFFITLSDLSEEATLSIFGWKSEVIGWGAIKEGMKVKVEGKPEIYKPTGRFSIYAFSIIPSGEGALKTAFKLLKNKLQKEGLFAPERKRPIPSFPQSIGLITALGSQAFKDFIKVLSHRLGGLTIHFYPVQVEGKLAITSILRALKFFEEKPKLVDVLVLVRGGGSLEQLSAFNSEEVARAIFGAKVPTAVGIGHEGDITLADLVADLRASTPSNAAELLVRDRNELKAQVNFLTDEIERILRHGLEVKRNQAFNLLISIEHKLANQKYQTEDLIQKTFYNLEKIERELKEKKMLGKNLTENLLFNQKRWLINIKEKVGFLIKELGNLSPLNILKRGYSICLTDADELITNPMEVGVGSLITNLFAQGKIASIVKRRQLT